MELCFHVKEKSYSGLNKTVISAPQVVDEYELVDPVDILTPMEKSGFWKGVKLEKWSERKEAISELTKLASINRISPHELTEVCRTLKKKEYNRIKMLEIIYGWRKASKCKELMRKVQCRLKLLKNRHCNDVRHLRDAVFELLKHGHYQPAFNMVDLIYKDECMIVVYELLDNFCEFVISHLSYIRRHKDCPNDIKEAISSLIFASSRCWDQPELLLIRYLFEERYGQMFVSTALELLTGHLVNHQMRKNLEINSVDDDVKHRLLDEIARNGPTSTPVTATRAPPAAEDVELALAINVSLHAQTTPNHEMTAGAPSAPPITSTSYVDNFIGGVDVAPPLHISGWEEYHEASSSRNIPAQTMPNQEMTAVAPPPIGPEVVDEGPTIENSNVPHVQMIPNKEMTPGIAPSALPIEKLGDREDGKKEESCSCVICLDAPVEGACIPCGHMAGCMSCLNQIKANNWPCPVCRANIHQVVRIYVV